MQTPISLGNSGIAQITELKQRAAARINRSHFGLWSEFLRLEQLVAATTLMIAGFLISGGTHVLLILLVVGIGLAATLAQSLSYWGRTEAPSLGTFRYSHAALLVGIFGLLTLSIGSSFLISTRTATLILVMAGLTLLEYLSGSEEPNAVLRGMLLGLAFLLGASTSPTLIPEGAYLTGSIVLLCIGFSLRGQRSSIIVSALGFAALAAMPWVALSVIRHFNDVSATPIFVAALAFAIWQIMNGRPLTMVIPIIAAALCVGYDYLFAAVVLALLQIAAVGIATISNDPGELRQKGKASLRPGRASLLSYVYRLSHSKSA